MTAINFYQLQRSSLEEALEKLLQKVLGGQARAVVLAGSEERVEVLNAALWTLSPSSFLPHGSRRDGHAASQPVWLTTEDENPNGASVLVLTDGMVSKRVQDYERCLELFDGDDAAAVTAARDRWRGYKAEGHTLSYWQQNPNGGWEKKEGQDT
jgi:DNA polymerase-3 subunit chi